MAKHFTKEQIDEIRRQLATDAVRDTDLPEADVLDYEDYVAIVQDGRNKKISGDTLRNNLSQGPRGESSYEIAVRHGYEGTEEEWLQDPVNGIKGISIEKIEQTHTSLVSDGVNVVTVTLTNGESSDFSVVNGHQGERGFQGLQGATGAQGLPGATGATGPKGDKGDKGDSGVSLGDVVLTTDLDETETGKALDASAMQTIPHFVDEEQEIEDVPSNYYTKPQMDAKIAAHTTSVNNALTAQDDQLRNMQTLVDDMEQVVSDFTLNHPTVINNGTINNAVDDEDLTTVGNVIKFKDRMPVGGMGYVILRRNKTFAEQVTKVNTIYEIRYDFDLGEASVSIPENSVLRFIGGKISNGTIVGTLTDIEAHKTQLFGQSLTIAGTWKISYVYPEWFGAKGDGETDCTAAINSSFVFNTNGRLCVMFSSGEYLITPNTISISRSNLSLVGESATIKTKQSSSYDYFITAASGLRDVSISGITFNQLEDTYNASSTSIGGCRIIKINSVDHLTISDCIFYSYGTQAIIVASVYRKDIVISRNKFYFKRHGNYNYDSSLVYIESLDHTITDNYFDGMYDFTGFESRGGLETHGNRYIVSGNTIINCFAGINATGHSSSVANEDGALINNNVINCANGVVLYPDSGGIRNLSILDNVIKIVKLVNPSYGGISINTGSTTETIDGLVVRGNYFSCSFLGTGTSAKLGALSLDDDGVINHIDFCANTIKGFRNYGVYVGSTVTTIGSLRIQDNTFIDCCDSDNSYNVLVSINKDMQHFDFSRNTIGFTETNLVFTYIVNITSTISGTIVINDNTSYSLTGDCSFERYNVPLTKLQTNQKGLRSLVAGREPNVTTSANSSFLKGDMLINSGKVYMAIDTVNTKQLSSSGTFNTKGVYTIYTAGEPYVDCGDAVTINASTYIVNAKIGKKLWFVGVDSSTSGTYAITAAGSASNLKEVSFVSES